jgi:hypothetical protein
MRSFAYGYRFTPEELTLARTGLEQAVQKSPDYADAERLVEGWRKSCCDQRGS